MTVVPRPFRKTGRAAALSLGLLCASATAGTGAASPAPTGPYVALGDSYVSGPLIPDQTGPTFCFRSTHDYPSLIAADLGTASFADVSCRGATTATMASPQTELGQQTNAAQLDALSPATRLVTLTIGGNDVGFTDVVTTCAGLSLIDPWGSPCRDHYTSGGTDRLAASVAATEPKVATVLAAIHARSPQARVLVVGYPDLLPESGSGCWPSVPLSSDDVPYLRDTEKALNAMLADAAGKNGAEYVDTYTSSIGHDACRPESERWIEPVIPGSAAVPMHPNAAGMAHTAAVVEAAISR